MKVKCVNAKGSGQCLILGKVYEVEWMTIPGRNYRLVGTYYSWEPNRFEEVAS